MTVYDYRLLWLQCERVIGITEDKQHIIDVKGFTVYLLCVRHVLSLMISRNTKIYTVQPFGCIYPTNSSEKRDCRASIDFCLHSMCIAEEVPHYINTSTTFNFSDKYSNIHVRRFFFLLLNIFVASCFEYVIKIEHGKDLTKNFIWMFQFVATEKRFVRNTSWFKAKKKQIIWATVFLHRSYESFVARRFP